MPTNNSVNAPFPLSATQGGLGVASPTATGICIAQGANPIVSQVLTNGQILIGAAGVDPAANTLNAGVGISIVNGSGTITISATGNDPYVDVTASTQQMAVNTSYGANKASAGFLIFTLPAVAAVGDTVEVLGVSASGWRIAQNAAQTIYFGNQNTTSGTGGSLDFTHRRDGVGLRCVVANTDWTVFRSVGNLTVT